MFIKEIRCSLPTFKTIILQKGINFIIAESNDDKDLQNREKTNSVGKTSILEIIKYCFGQIMKSKPFKSALEFTNCTYSILLGDLKKNFFLISKNNSESIFKVLNYSDDSLTKLSRNDYLTWLEQNVLYISETFIDNPLSTFLRSDVTKIRPLDIHFSEKLWKRNYRILSCLGINLKSFYLNLNNLIEVNEMEKIILSNDSIKSSLFGYETKEEILDTISNHEEKLQNIIQERELIEVGDLETLNLKSKKVFNIDNLKLENEKLKLDVKKISSVIEKNNKKILKIKENEKLIKEFQNIFNLNVVNNFEKVNEFHKLLFNNLNSFMQEDIKNINNYISKNNKIINDTSDDLKLSFTFSDLMKSNIKKEGIELEKVENLKQILDKFYNKEIKNISIEEIKEEVQSINTLELNSQINDFVLKANTLFTELFPKYNINLKWQFENFKKKISNKYGPIFSISCEEQGEGKSHLQAILFDLSLVLFGNINFFLIHDSNIFDPMDRSDLALILNDMEDKNILNQYILLIREDNINFIDLNNKLKNKWETSLKLSTNEKLFGFDF